MSKIDELFLEREFKGLRVSLALKIIFFLTMLAGSFSPEATHFERVYGGIISFVAVSLLLFFLFLIRKKTRLGFVGIASAITDNLFLAAIVIIWYFAVGGTAVSPAFLLKSTIYTFSAGLIILNSFALKPLYPAIVGIGFTLTQIGFFVFAVSIDANMNTDSFVDHLLGKGVSYFLYFAVHIAMPLLFACAALTYLTYIARSMVRRAVVMEKHKSQMERYFSPHIAERISTADEDFLRPGGTRRNVAVMFCDIRGFTTISETLSPEEVVELLSSYHACMVEVIFRHRGTLDKYIGDAIMATFGTPTPTAEDADNAVRAALDMRSALREFNFRQREKNRMELKSGIAIHFGEAIVGNIGTTDRLEFTVIGDTVNIASRMESLCKEFNTDIVVSESVRERTSGTHRFVSLGEVTLRGKDRPVHVYRME